MHDLLGGAMLCIAMLHYALHCIALRCMCMPSEERIHLIGVAPGSFIYADGPLEIILVGVGVWKTLAVLKFD